jgi:translation elongation factor P/translation initiation factor 5A
MIDATHIRKNMILKMEDGQLWRVVEMQLITPGRWKAMVQTKLRSLKDNSVKDHRFRSVDRVEQIHLDAAEMEFLYQSGDEYIFMNQETFDQVHSSRPRPSATPSSTSSPTSSSPSKATTASRSTSSPRPSWR